VQKWIIVTILIIIFGYSEYVLAEEWQESLIMGKFGSWDKPLGEKLFKFPYSISGGTVEKIESEGPSINVMISNEQTDATLQIKIPRHYPSSNVIDEVSRSDVFVLIDSEEYREYQKLISECYVEYSILIPINSKNVEFAFTTVLSAGHPMRGENVSEQCIKETVDSNYQNTKFLSPRKQIQHKIIPSQIICNQGLELVAKASDFSPACVKPSSIEKLIERGWRTF